MNDLETQIRATLRHHEHESPRSGASDARRAAARTRRRQLRNAVGGGICALAIGTALFLGLDGLQRAERPASLSDSPTPSRSATPTPQADTVHDGLPGANPAPAGTYSWNANRSAWMHNVTGEAGGLGVQLTFSTIAEVPVDGGAPVTVAGYDAIHRILGENGSPAGRPPLGEGSARATTEEWIVDIDGTVVSIVLAAPLDTPDSELAAARAIIGSIRAVPREGEPGFKLTFELPYGWDVG